MSTSIEYWQQANPFTITLRGHQRNIPYPDSEILKDSYNPEQYKLENDITSLIQQVTGNNNYNKTYDSFYSPVDFKFSAITIRLPDALPEKAEYKISFKINGGEIELLPIPQLQNYNIMIYGTECDIHVWEDDFIEVSVDFSDESIYELLTWNNNNMTIALCGCFWYEAYKNAFPEGTKEWELGDAYFKTNITLQNRSGNDLFTDRFFSDIVKSPVSFLIQGIRLSMFSDNLMTDDKLTRTNSCFYVDILVNGKSVNAALDIERPISIDSLETNLKNYNSTYNNISGYPVIVGDDILIKVYQKNQTAKFNSRILEVILFGCASDCATLQSDSVSVYELCATTTPCESKFTVEVNCNPNNIDKTTINVSSSNY
jgi:hypothetical protein